MNELMTTEAERGSARGRSAGKRTVPDKSGEMLIQKGALQFIDDLKKADGRAQNGIAALRTRC